jgi:hypothetical protein
MSISMRSLAAIAGAGLLCLAAPTSADTLQMKDGRVIQGRFLGGTQASVQFETNGKIELYNVGDIILVTFTGQAPDRPAPARDSAPPPPPAPPARPAAARESVAPDAPTPAAGPATAVASTGSITVPAGTHILVRMIDSVDSNKNNVGDRFRASLEQDFVVEGTVISPKGADVYGRLAEAKEAGHFEGKAQLKLELTDLVINSRMHPIMTGDYEVSGESRGADTAKKVGIGAVAGTIIGAIAGGGKGAAIGAGVGAGAGAAVQVMTKGEQVHVPSETLLDFRIEQPFTATPAGQ